jgi:coenzyme F420-reducing hydrogenase delta subunit
MLDYLGIEKERTRVEWVSAAEGVKFSTTMNEFVGAVRELGPNRRLGDLRCKD